MTWREQLGKDNRGSRPSCVLLVDGDGKEVADRLTRLINFPDVIVSSDDKWKPCGKWDVVEAQLDKADNLVPCSEIRWQLRNWWLSVNGRARTPNWDIASTCRIKGKPGLLLVEAKAHVNELSCSGKPLRKEASQNSRKNHERIGRAIAEANEAFQAATGGKWGLSRDHHYQLSNRFAWSWKLASLGIPVVLVYLGFLNAKNMKNQEKIFHSNDDWESALKSYGKGVVGNTCWGECLDFCGVPLLPLIRGYCQPFESCEINHMS